MGARTHALAPRATAIVAAALAAALLAACGTGSALGLEQPPAALDPASLMLLAKDVAFDRAELDVRAGEPFVLVLENRDTVSHNVSIYADAALGDRRFEGVLFGGPGTRWYPVPALTAGAYVFVCDLHASMRGRLVVT